MIRARTLAAIWLTTGALAAMVGVPAPAAERNRRHHHAAPRAVQAQPSPMYGATQGVPAGGYDNPEVNNGSFAPQFKPNDPQRPYGAYSTVTAPPGTDAAKEQENNRRYFCNFAPEHC